MVKRAMAALTSLGLSWPIAAQANGKFPAADQLVVAGGDPDHIAMMSTFGVLTTSNAGQDWDVICESAAQYGDYEPAIALTTAGTFLLALDEGVGVGRDGGCSWSLASGIVEPVVDVTQSAAEPGTAVAITTFAADSGYWASMDDAATFQQVSAFPPGFAALTVDVAPSDPMRVYASGIDVNADQGQLARSDDGGVTWTTFPIADSSTEFQPFIGALDPQDPDRLYVRLTGPGRLLATEDAGESWNEIFTSPMNKLLGLAVSPDGQRIAVGTEFDGMWRADTDDYAFAKVSEVAVRCLTWTDAGLYACVNEFLVGDGFIVGRSSDGGDSFEPLVSLACLRGMLACDPGTRVGDLCPARWPALADQLMSDTCDGTDAGGSGATGGAGGSAGEGGSSDGERGADDGCGCAVVGVAERQTRAVLWLVGLIVVLGATRRRWKMSPPM
ncbi:MAG TPA: hypothetical protein ENK57_05220 [Polyangiaceae bacterium]|nr:hypothetical protein [Polyangiaceae bacterium]